MQDLRSLIGLFCRGNVLIVRRESTRGSLTVARVR
jgi:hypothetical protein